MARRWSCEMTLKTQPHWRRADPDGTDFPPHFGFEVPSANCV